MDIETAPAISMVWGVYDQNVPPNHILEYPYLMCWSAKWLGNSRMMSDSAFNYPRDLKSNKKDAGVCKTIHKLLCEADIVVAHNGDDFDVKRLNTFFKKNDMPPPRPFYTVDTKKVAKGNFGFMSNKLDFLCKELGIGSKIENGGISLWKRCMDGDKKAWATMLKYNKRDVTLLEELYVYLRPYMKRHPHIGMLSDNPTACPTCGSLNRVHAGRARTARGMIQRYICGDCSHYYRDNGPRTTSGLPDVSRRSN